MYILCPVYDADGVLCFDPVFVEDSEHFDAGVDAEDAVVATARGLRVEMRADEGGWFVVFQTGANGEDVAHFVDGDFTT